MTKPTQRMRIVALERRLAYLREKLARFEGEGRPAGYLAAEIVALEWALPVLARHLAVNAGGEGAEALGEVALRYSAVVGALVDGIAGALDGAGDETRRALEAVIEDARAQVAAVGDALEAAIRDLPDTAAT